VLERFEFSEDSQGKKKSILRISLANAICKSLKNLRDATNGQLQAAQYLSV